MSPKGPNAAAESPVCPVTGSVETLPLCQVNGYRIWRCPKSATDFVWPPPPRTTEERKEENEPLLSLFTTWLANYHEVRSAGSILDVYCGQGARLAIAASQGWKCFGIEPSASAREEANETHGSAFYLVDRVEHLIPHKFDLIVLFDALDRLQNPQQLLYELFSRGAIGNDTRLIIGTPNARCYQAVSNPSGWAHRCPPSKVVYYSAKSLRSLLEKLHFKEIRISGVQELPKESTSHHEESAARYQDEVLSPDENLARYEWLVCEAEGSDFAEFMHERYVPGTWSKLAEYEHVPRYAFAREMARGKRVLDFGCGTGYGTAMLGEVAESVLGIDIDV